MYTVALDMSLAPVNTHPCLFVHGRVDLHCSSGLKVGQERVVVDGGSGVGWWLVVGAVGVLRT